MHIQTHLISDLPVFETETSVKKVIRFFKGTTFSHVAIKEGDEFRGMLSEYDLQTFEKKSKIGDYKYNLEAFFVRNEANWLDVIETFARNEANLLPVLDDQNKAIGYYELTDIVGAFIDTPFFTEPGGILVVAKGVNDYSLSEIVQIVESNNTKIIGAFITDMRNDVIEVTLKISASNTNEVVQTFRRYNYNILSGNNDDQFLEDLRQRSEYLDKYLNV